MKRTIIAAALLAVTGAANAGLSFDALSTVSRTEEFNLAGFATQAVGSTLKIGTLKADNPYKVTYTYLGSESGFDNVFYNLYVNGSKLFESTDNPDILPNGFTNPVGTSVTGNMANAGALDFAFEGIQGQNKLAYNDRVLHGGYNTGGTTPGWAEGTSIGLIGTNMTINSQTFAYVIGYNDSAGSATLGDWDDFVIGVNIAPIPEPETYAMLLAGLGLMGFVARRRKKSAAI
jgi:hypothetical protein